MRRAVLGIAACVLAVTMGCNQRTAVKKGDRFVVLEDLRTNAATEWEQPFTDGFATLIPRGTVVETRFTTTPGAAFFECVPVEVNKSRNAIVITEYFVPEGTRMREGFKGFSFNLPVADIGTKMKRLPREP